MMKPLHNLEILRHVIPQNDKYTIFCHAELVEASRLLVFFDLCKGLR